MRWQHRLAIGNRRHSLLLVIAGYFMRAVVVFVPDREMSASESRIFLDFRLFVAQSFRRRHPPGTEAIDGQAAVRADGAPGRNGPSAVIRRSAELEASEPQPCRPWRPFDHVVGGRRGRSLPGVAERIPTSRVRGWVSIEEAVGHQRNAVPHRWQYRPVFWSRKVMKAHCVP